MPGTVLTRAVMGAALALASFAISSQLAADVAHGHVEAIGGPGKATEATRTIQIVMFDNYYEPETISVKEGEIVRFLVRNDGAFVHEFSIATAELHHAHQAEMQMMVDHGVLEGTRINWSAARAMQQTMGHGMHDEPGSVLLEPGQSGEIVWTFPDHAELEFACNVPGHYEAGMQGMIELTH